jgi:hypothetical protein
MSCELEDQKEMKNEKDQGFFQDCMSNWVQA